VFRTDDSIQRRHRTMPGIVLLLGSVVLLFFLGRFLYRRLVDRTTSRNLRTLLTALGICVLIGMIALVAVALSAR